MKLNSGFLTYLMPQSAVPHDDRIGAVIPAKALAYRDKLDEKGDPIDHNWVVSTEIAESLSEEEIKLSGKYSEINLACLPGSILAYEDINYTFVHPSPHKLYLSQSRKAFERARLCNPMKAAFETDSGHELPTSITFDYLEEIATSIIFAHIAIEAFSNERIPLDYEQQSGKKYGKRSKSAIERYATLDDKLNIVLPSICNASPLSETNLWNDYCLLKSIRDRLVHTKDTENTPAYLEEGESEHQNESIWPLLIQPQQLCYPDLAASVISHFGGIVPIAMVIQ